MPTEDPYAHYPQGPCCVEVGGGRESGPRIYGPFTSFAEARTWMDLQYQEGFRGNFSILWLRTPFKVRTNEDWWYSQKLLEEEHQTTEAWFTINPYSEKD